MPSISVTVVWPSVTLADASNSKKEKVAVRSAGMSMGQSSRCSGVTRLGHGTQEYEARRRLTVRRPDHGTRAPSSREALTSVIPAYGRGRCRDDGRCERARGPKRVRRRSALSDAQYRCRTEVHADQRRSKRRRPAAAYTPPIPNENAPASGAFSNITRAGSEAVGHSRGEQVDRFVGFVALPQQAHAEVAVEVVLHADAPGDLGLVVAAARHFDVDVGDAQLAEDGELVGDREHAHGDRFQRFDFDAALVVEQAIAELRRDVAVESV